MTNTPTGSRLLSTIVRRPSLIAKNLRKTLGLVTTSIWPRNKPPRLAREITRHVPPSTTSRRSSVFRPPGSDFEGFPLSVEERGGHRAHHQEDDREHQQEDGDT